jgi:hypothetical protein
MIGVDRSNEQLFNATFCLDTASGISVQDQIADSASHPAFHLDHSTKHMNYCCHALKFIKPKARRSAVLSSFPSPFSEPNR